MPTEVPSPRSVSPAPVDKRFDALLLASTSIVWWTDASGEFVERQPFWEAYTGQAWEQYRGSGWAACLHPDDRESILADWTNAVASGGQYLTQGRVWSAKHNAYRAFQTRGIAIRNDNGQIFEWLGALTDVQDTLDSKVLLEGARADLAAALKAQRLSEATARAHLAKAAREATALARLNNASARLWQTHDLREGLNEMLRAAIELLAADRGNIQLLDAAKGTLVIAAHQGFDEDFLEFFKEVSTDDDSACGRALRSAADVTIEDIEADEAYTPYRSVARAAGYRALHSTPLIGRNGMPLGMLSTHFGKVHRPAEHELKLLQLYTRQAAAFIERIRAESRQEILMNELTHRGNNMLQVIHSIARRTFPESIEREAFLGRLQALSRMYHSLVGERFDGAPMRAIVDNEVSMFSARVRITGPDLVLNSKAAQTFSLVLHELSTNAVKYGAWSNSTGIVAISWSIDDDRAEPELRFRWQEEGGPSVKVPTRRGFGSVVLQKVVQGEFGRPAGEHFVMSGYSYALSAPLNVVQPPGTNAAPRRAPWNQRALTAHVAQKNT